MDGRKRAIVAGAGHNGLVCAALLAKAGNRVLVLEANKQVGGAAVTREHLLEDLVNYVGHLRRHMEWEESDLFPRADSLARDNETATIDVSQHMGDDPVFGATTASSFSNLLANLQRAQ